MSPSRERAQDTSISAVDDGQWEDYTCVTPWEEFIRSLEDVLREWKGCDADLVVAATGDDSQTDSPPLPSSSYSRCLEHDGQLFSIQLVPPPRSDGPATPPPTSTTTSANSNNNCAASTACELENHQLDFDRGGGGGGGVTTSMQRWFGLKQYVLLRALGHSDSGGMDVDQLLWATTVAAGNCKCSVPVLVSCDWDGLGGVRQGGGGGEGREMEGGASCKGYSAPGSKGVSCSVRFQTESTAKPPPECLYLDGLTDLFLSKIRDAHCLPGRAFAPRVSITVQKAWEWSKASADNGTPLLSAPGLVRDELVQPTHVVTRLDASGRELVVGGSGNGRMGTGGGVFGAVMTRDAVRGVSVDERKGAEQRDIAVGKLMRGVRGCAEGDILWGPDEDPLLSWCIRVRWTDMREGLVEESRHYTTLDPLPEEPEASLFGDAAGLEGSSGQWFVKVGWNNSARDAGDRGSKRPQADGRLGEACCRLLAALVLTTTMHPGTLMADLGAAPGPDSPTVKAEDYGKAAATTLSRETRASVEEMCSKTRSPPIDHDQIDLILRHLLHPSEQLDQSAKSTVSSPSGPPSAAVNSDNNSSNHGSQPYADTEPDAINTSSVVSMSGVGDTPRGDSTGKSSSWRQVYPREEGAVGGRSVGEEARRPTREEDGDAGGGAPPLDDGVGVGGGGGRNGGSMLAASDGSAADNPGRGLSTWTERGGAKIGHLLSLLSLRVAKCDDLRSMSLLWMSFVRDVRLLWEDGAAIARMSPILELDGASMYDRSASCTGQDRSIAAQMRGGRAGDADPGDAMPISSSCADGCKGGGCNGEESGEAFSRGEDRSYPDMRMCLIWQKLQMLNSCRLEEIVATAAARGVAALAEQQQQQKQRQSGGRAGEGSTSGDAGGDEEEDEDAMFFDTREYYQPSENGGDDDGGGGGRNDNDHVNDHDNDNDHNNHDDNDHDNDRGSSSSLRADVHGDGQVDADHDEEEEEDKDLGLAVVADGAKGIALGVAPGGDAVVAVSRRAAGMGGGTATGTFRSAIAAADDKCDDDCNVDAGGHGEGVSAEADINSGVTPPEPDDVVGVTRHQQTATTVVSAKATTNHETRNRDRSTGSNSSSVIGDDSIGDSVDVVVDEPRAAEASVETSDGAQQPASAASAAGAGASLPTEIPVASLPTEKHVALLPTEAPVASLLTETQVAPLPTETHIASLPTETHTATADSTSSSSSTEIIPPAIVVHIASNHGPAAETESELPPPPLVAVVVDDFSPPTLDSPTRGRNALDRRRSPAVQAPPTVTPTTSAETPVLVPPPLLSAAAATGTTDGRHLLCLSGVEVRSPRLPTSGPVTVDMLEQQAMEPAAAYRGREVLVADMVAFLESNEGAVFADFVRWYRPECWQGVAASDAEWAEASNDRTGGSTEDARRLAWPGRGQVVWRSPAQVTRSRCLDKGAVPTSESCAPAAARSPFTLAGWLSCWGDAGVVKTGMRARRSLFSSVKEGEKALHYLETISPSLLLAQLLSALLGLSVFVLDDAASSADSLPAAQDAAEVARRRVEEAVRLLDASVIDSGATVAAAAVDGEKGQPGIRRSDSTSRVGCVPANVPANVRRFFDEEAGVVLNSNKKLSSSSFRTALLAADAACLEIKKAETVLARAFSLRRAMPGQEGLANAIVAHEMGVAEVPVERRSQKEFLKGLLLAQGGVKTPGAELDDLLASYDEEDRREHNSGKADTEEEVGNAMPPPHTKEYVLRCQTPAPFYARNVGRRQIDGYPTPPSRMYAKTDGRQLRVALSMCESEI